jgi:hypothetical protein
MKYNYNILKNSIIIIISSILLVLIYNKFFNKSRLGFQNYTNTKWSPDLIKRFNIYQTTMNKNVNQFNLDILQKQATPEEAEEYLKTGLWDWPDYLKDLYVEAIWSSPIVKIDPQIALNYALTLYNKNAATELLAWNTKEGNFLLYGGNLGSGSHNSIKCSGDEKSVMQKQISLGLGEWNYKTENIKLEDIPKEMPGFSFVNKPCNPCSVFDDTTNNNCPFKLNIEGDDNISEPWKKIWGL